MPRGHEVLQRTHLVSENRLPGHVPERYHPGSHEVWQLVHVTVSESDVPEQLREMYDPGEQEALQGMQVVVSDKVVPEHLPEKYHPCPQDSLHFLHILSLVGADVQLPNMYSPGAHSVHCTTVTVTVMVTVTVTATDIVTIRRAIEL